MNRFAKIQLRLIHNYHNDKAGIKVARKITKNLLHCPNILKRHLLSGQEELNLKELMQGHRYLVEYNFKIIYLVRGESIFITDIFDSRQDPKKLRNRNK